MSSGAKTHAASLPSSRNSTRSSFSPMRQKKFTAANTVKRNIPIQTADKNTAQKSPHSRGLFYIADFIIFVKNDSQNGRRQQQLHSIFKNRRLKHQLPELEYGLS